MAEKDRKSNKGLIAIVVLLLVTIGILLWLLLRPVPEPEKVSTGNVDIFDIRIGCICKRKSDKKDDDDKGGDECDQDEDGFRPNVTPGKNGSNGGYDSGKVNGKTDPDTDVNKEGIVYVDDINDWYVYQKNLKIFENAAFEYTNKIAPGVSNSYNFKVHNETDNAIRYNIEFLEESEYNINLQYRLKRAGSYVVGSDSSWVNASQLASAMKYLATDGIDSYTLDWRWPYESGKDAQDTKAGEKMKSEYYLGIKVNFEDV